VTFSPERSARDRTRRRFIGNVLLGVAIGGIVLGFSLPAPYVIETPGPVFNVLGDLNGTPIISTKEVKTYPTDGELDALTVSSLGTPTTKPTWLQVMAAWISSEAKVIPMEVVYPAGASDQQIAERVKTMMTDSQQDAVAVALRRSGYEVPALIAVQAIQAKMPAVGLFKAGDIIKSVEGVTPKSTKDVSTQINLHNGNPVHFVVERSGHVKQLVVTPTHTKADPVWRIGIYPGTKYQMPVKVTIDLGDVSGPSAGMMFTLGLIDKLSPGSLTGGVHIAGTGTIDAKENIGAIGGIGLKMKAAIKAGAKLFIGPRDNCDEITGHIPAGLQVVTVTKLSEALDLLGQVSGKRAVPSDLSTGCPAN